MKRQDLEARQGLVKPIFGEVENGVIAEEQHFRMKLQSLDQRHEEAPVSSHFSSDDQRGHATWRNAVQHLIARLGVADAVVENHHGAAMRIIRHVCLPVPSVDQHHILRVRRGCQDGAEFGGLMQRFLLSRQIRESVTEHLDAKRGADGRPSRRQRKRLQVEDLTPGKHQGAE